MNAFGLDLRLALRSLARNPGYAAVSVIVLALGLGLTVFMFSAVKGYILSPLPFLEPQELVQIGVTEPGSNDDSHAVAPWHFERWRLEHRQGGSLAAYFMGTINLSGDDRPERLRGGFVSANAFEVLRVAPFLGRTFVEGEDGHGEPLVIVIGHDLWRHRFNEAADVVGTRIRVNGREAEIVGVMPPGFRFPFDEDAWLPMQQDLSTDTARESASWLTVFGRAAPGEQSQWQGAMQSLHAQLLAEAADETSPSQVTVRPLASLLIAPEFRTVVLTLFASVVFVLLIACANVANLTFARTIARRREVAIRVSLGASRGRLVGGVLVEVVMVALAGAALGVLLSEWGGAYMDRVLAAADTTIPYWVDFSLDWTMAGFAFAAALGTALLAGFLPAWHASGTDPNQGLRDGGYGASDRRQGRASRMLVTFQIALCSVLLICAGLMLRSAIQMNATDDGLAHRTAMTGRFGLFEAQYPEAADRMRIFERVQEELASIEGVRHATLTTALPMAGSSWTSYLPAGAEPPPDGRLPSTRYAAASTNFFDAFGVPLLRGRGFTEADRLDTVPVAVVNTAFAQRVWPGEEPVGQRLLLGGQDAREVTVVGVVGNYVHSQGDFRTGVQPAVHVPLAQAPPRFLSLAVTTDGEPGRLASSVREAMLRVEPDTPIYWLRTFEEVTAIATFDTRLLAVLFAIFAVVAVVLTATGVYAVLAYAVGQRTREIGIRRALGASNRGILRMVAGQGGRQFLIGMAIGLAGAALFARLIHWMFVGVKPYDPATYAGVFVLLCVLAFVASCVPAARALKVQPMVSLRQD